MRRIIPALAAFLVAVVLVSGCSAGAPTPTVARPVSVTGPAGSATSAATEAAVRELYTSRLEGLRRDDSAAWLHGLTGPALVEQQRAIFERMRALGTSDIVVTGVRQRDPVAAAADHGPRRLEVRLSYRFAGFDTAPRQFALDVTVARPTPTSGIAITASRPADRPQPWDLPELQVRRSESVLVAVSGTAARADDLAKEVRSAARRVAGVLGAARPAVVLAPADDGLAALLLGRPQSGLTGVAAVTDGPLEGGRAGADRVVIVPGAWASLSATGREVVLAHELTHVATRAQPNQGLPLWLSEGFAEYVAYDAVRLPESVIARPAIEQVRRAGVPAQWPADRQFEPGTATLSAAYGLALLACRSIAERHGQPALVRFYRAAATRPMDAAFRAIGTDEPTERRAWQARVAALLDGPVQP